MRKLISIFVVFIISLSFMHVNEDRSNEISKNNSVEELWQVTVSDYLNDDLWLDEYSYDASHYLMIPLKYAFKRNDSNKIQEFQNHFDRFSNVGFEGKTSYENRLTRLHYMYLITQFLKHTAINGEFKEKHIKLVNIVENEISIIWDGTPSWQWDREDFANGMVERLKWKLDNFKVKYSYYRAIIDEELFTLSIAADLVFIDKKENILRDKRKIILMRDIFYQILLQECIFLDDTRWIFQPGVWTDSPSYNMAGYKSIDEINGEKPVKNIAWDTSHSHRFPMWITSLKESYQIGTPEYEMCSRYLEGLFEQFTQVVLSYPSDNNIGYLTTNFMDGRNGLYRYDKLTNTAYLPYGLSGTLNLGWWVVLDREEIYTMYNEIANQYPLNDELLRYYYEPRISRTRHSLTEDRNSYKNGFRELIVKLAAELKCR